MMVGQLLSEGSLPSPVLWEVETDWLAHVDTNRYQRGNWLQFVS